MCQKKLKLSEVEAAFQIEQSAMPFMAPSSAPPMLHFGLQTQQSNPMCPASSAVFLAMSRSSATSMLHAERTLKPLSCRSARSPMLQPRHARLRSRLIEHPTHHPHPKQLRWLSQQVFTLLDHHLAMLTCLDCRHRHHFSYDAPPVVVHQLHA
jgi:hypothetical protein